MQCSFSWEELGFLSSFCDPNCCLLLREFSRLSELWLKICLDEFVKLSFANLVLIKGYFVIMIYAGFLLFKVVLIK